RPARAWNRPLRDQEVARGGGVDALRHERVADAARQDEGQLAALGLLVLSHVRRQRIGAERTAGDVAEPRRQSGRGDGAGRALGVLARAEAEARREPERQRAADADRLAM